MSAEIRKYMGLEALLVDVWRGHFNILSNDMTVFSKMKEGRYPREREILKRLKNR